MRIVRKLALFGLNCVEAAFPLKTTIAAIHWPNQIID